MAQPGRAGAGRVIVSDRQACYTEGTILELTTWWRNAALPEAQAFLAWLQDLYRQEQSHLAGYHEPLLEAHWFRPIVARLGHVFEPAWTGGSTPRLRLLPG